MKLPSINQIRTTRDTVDIFGGYNHNLRIGAGEFYDMKNLTSSHYPILSPRDRRSFFKKNITSPNGMIVANETLCYVDGQNFVIGDTTVFFGLNNEPKTLVAMGSYVLIFPDGKYVNTANLDDYSDRGDIEQSFTAKMNLYTCDEFGYSITWSYGNQAPISPQNGDYWYNPNGDGLQKFSSEQNSWISVEVLTCICGDRGNFSRFSKGDSVKISGISDNDDYHSVMNNRYVKVVYDNHSDKLVVSGYERYSGAVFTSEECTLTVTKEVPDLDYVTEAGNRLWGCRYGTDDDGNMINEIYASALGDFKTWNKFDGVSTDSYVASVGTDGAFTGAITYMGRPMFFKENCMHKIYGDYPANFQIQTTSCRGVQAGCDKSLAIVNEVLYYKSRSAVCAYDGSVPTEISSALGEIRYHNAIAGGHRNKYYICMNDDANVSQLFAYDTKKGLWHKEDNATITSFCTYNGDLYFIENKDIKCVVSVDGEEIEGKLSWSAETGIIGVDNPDKKYISRIDIRLALDISTRVTLMAQYDSMGGWEHLFTMTGETLRSFSIPLRPKRCDHLRLKIEGYGDAKIYSITKTIEQGSDA